MNLEARINKAVASLVGQEETLYLALPPDTVRPMSKELQRLIGYEKKGSLTLGWLDGRDPRELLDLDT